jgi:hypothetical protein
MLRRWLHRERTLPGVLLCGLLVLAAYLAGARAPEDTAARDDIRPLLTGRPWVCEVGDPAGSGVVATAVETFEADGRRTGRLRLEDRRDQRLLVDLRFSGRWQFDPPVFTGAIHEYHYEHVDRAAFSLERLAAIEAEFSEPEELRVLALSERQLVFSGERALYQCHRNESVPTTST